MKFLSGLYSKLRWATEALSYFELFLGQIYGKNAKTRNMVFCLAFVGFAEKIPRTCSQQYKHKGHPLIFAGKLGRTPWWGYSLHFYSQPKGDLLSYPSKMQLCCPQSNKPVEHWQNNFIFFCEIKPIPWNFCRSYFQTWKTGSSLSVCGLSEIQC